MNQLKQFITIILFAAILFGGMTAHLLSPDQQRSESERRLLKQKPPLSINTVLSGTFMEQFEAYALDQFPGRDLFRTKKALSALFLFAQKDNNGLYLADHHLSKLDYPLHENSVKNAIRHILAIQEKYLESSALFYSVVWDKNYFLAEANGYPSMDYQKLSKILEDGLEGFLYLDISESLSIEDYYRTDTHWRQECLIDTASSLLLQMGREELSPFSYEAIKAGDFYGVLAGQAALPVRSDQLIYLTNEKQKLIQVYDLSTNEPLPVYQTDIWHDPKSVDPYDIFLSGAVPLIEMINPSVDESRELILFRDSFGSSLAPLLAEKYHSILLVDTRYISMNLLGQYIDFHGQDVLFMYNTMLLNNSYSLK